MFQRNLKSSNTIYFTLQDKSYWNSRDNQSQKLCNATFLEQYRTFLEESMSRKTSSPNLSVERLIHNDLDLVVKAIETDSCKEEWGSLENLNNLYKDVHLLGSAFPIFQWVFLLSGSIKKNTFNSRYSNLREISDSEIGKFAQKLWIASTKNKENNEFNATSILPVLSAVCGDVNHFPIVPSPNLKTSFKPSK